MKFMAYISVFLAALFVAQTASAQAPQGLTTAQIRTNCKANVSTLDNGDVVIKSLRAPTGEEMRKADNVPGIILMLLLYVDPNMDFEKFNAIMAKISGGKKVYVSDIMEAADKYLSSNNMSFRSTKFSENNARIKIDSGLPLFLQIRKCSEISDIKNRNEARAKAANMKEWSKSLRKLTVKKITKDGTLVNFALIIGYNKDTSEFFCLVEGSPVWMTASEIKLMQTGLYELRI